MSKYDERITRMRFDRLQILQKVRENTISHKDVLSEDIDSVMTVLNLEEESAKKYEAVIQAKELIASLTEEIVNADSVEKVTELRKKLNYYINKIKSEIKKRNVSEEVLESYQEKVFYLRKDIARYIRTLKRESIISDVEKTNERFEELNDDEKKLFQKMLRHEIKYNTRTYDQLSQGDSYQPKKSKVVDNKPEEVVSQVTKEDDSPAEIAKFQEELSKAISDRGLDEPDVEESLSFDEESGTTEKKDFVPFHEEVNGKSFSFKKCTELTLSEFSEVSPYLQEKVIAYKRQYDIEDTIDYGKSKIKNLVSFFKNLPLIRNNKRGMKLMRRDMSIFYSGSDLVSFYEYTRRRNSIKEGLKSIFKGSRLYQNEDVYLAQHDQCSQWLYEFCKNNSMSLLVPLEYSR